MIERQLLHLLPFILLFCINIDEVFMTKTFLSPNRTLSWHDPKNPNKAPDRAYPEQVHLAMDGPSRYIVTWSTFSDPGSSYLTYGHGKDFNTVRVEADTTWFFFLFPQWLYVHKVVIDGIEPGKYYSYRVGSDYAYSSVFQFKGIEERPNGGHKVAVFGDFGYENSRSLAPLTDMTHNEEIDFVMHVGDMAYDLPFTGNQFMRMIEPIASKVPYMVSPGNHEMELLPYHNYVYRFNMPNSHDNYYYSYDVGKMHVISFSTEFYYDPFNGKWRGLRQRQYEWLEQDLIKANKNRAKTPWIITLGHRPMYCSTDDRDDCRNDEAATRVGVNGMYALEPLFYKYGVDFEVWAHEHTYERLWPVYDRRVYNGTTEPYVDPPAPVHIISGSAGCKENTDTFINDPPVWSAFRSTNYGFSLMQVHNDTHLHWQQIRAHDRGIEDDVWIIKHKHAPYTKEDKKKLKKHSVKVPYKKAKSWLDKEEEINLNRTPKDL
ncbi:unnamed protein product [Bursaphelenchus okinawaensis]|uniref:Purple acid phosphatase n=1 Tax=Bursaphelenchus okinawaensis TaxID=465554 RepID=A0A811LMW1_9BILA|nr:unnamed protein product [Bursaphelenchus okinawaensis]CAG9128275.1 unnamed protein product [Bursaphelenchus okinawaensis]